MSVHKWIYTHFSQWHHTVKREHRIAGCNSNQIRENSCPWCYVDVSAQRMHHIIGGCEFRENRNCQQECNKNPKERAKYGFHSIRISRRAIRHHQNINNRLVPIECVLFMRAMTFTWHKRIVALWTGWKIAFRMLATTTNLHITHLGWKYFECTISCATNIYCIWCHCVHESKTVTFLPNVSL